MVNSVTACSDAATALPGSTLRVRMTPSVGARIDAFDRLISSVDSAARALVDAGARAGLVGPGALERRASGVELGLRRHLAARQSRHLLEAAEAACGLLHGGDRLRDLGVRPRRAWRASAGSGRAAWRVSSSTSTWPFLTRSLTSTITLRHRARQLAADGDRARRLQRAVGDDRQRRSPRVTGGGDVDRCGRALLLRPPHGHGADSDSDRQHDGDPGVGRRHQAGAGASSS